MAASEKEVIVMADVRFTISADELFLQKIDDYRFGNRLRSRTQAAFELIKLGLGADTQMAMPEKNDGKPDTEPIDKTRLTLSVDEGTMNKIDDYQFENRFASRTQAVLDLIQKGLVVSENMAIDS